MLLRQKLDSDVPVSSGIRSHTSPMYRIDNFEVELVHAPSGLFSNEAAVRFYISVILPHNFSSWVYYLSEVNVNDYNDPQNSDRKLR